MADVEMAKVGGAGATQPEVHPSIQMQLPPDISMETLLSTFQSLPQELTPDFQVTEQLLLNPTAPLVQTLYKALVALPSLVQSSKDLEKERAETIAREVEIEASLNEAERLRSEAIERSQKEREEREQAEKLKDEVNVTLASVQAELTGLKSTSESGSNVSAELKGRLEGIEQEKRDLLSKVEREQTECNRRGEEIETLSTSNKELRRSESRLTTGLQEARSAEGLSKFKIQSLEQELALARKDAEWAHTELTNTTNSATTFRNNSHAEILKLQTALDTAQQSNSTLSTKISSLQSAYDSSVSRLNESNDKLTDLQTRLASEAESFRNEINTQQRLNSLLERRAEDSHRKAEDLEGQWQETLENCREREEAAQQEANEERESRERIENEKAELQVALDRLAESVGIQVRANGNGSANGSLPGTPLRGLASLPNSQMMSPTAALAGKVQKSGISFTQIYADLAKTQEELRREKVEREKLENIVSEIEAEIQDRAPALAAQREEVERLHLELEEMSSHFASACQEKDEAERTSEDRGLELQKATRENEIMSQQLADLGRQVRALLREVTIRDDPSAAERLEADGSELPDPTLGGDEDHDQDETQAIITSQLVTFSSLTDLCAQNARLLRVTRELGSRMEKEEEDYKNKLARSESGAVQEASRVIQRLNEALRSEKAMTEAARKERDIFRSMAASGRGRAASGSGAGQGAGGVFQSSNHDDARQQELARSYTQLQTQFDAFKTETATDTERLKNDVLEARREAGQASIQAAREKGAKENAEERVITLQQSLELQKSELVELTKQKTAIQTNLARRDISAHQTEEQLHQIRSNYEILRNEAANLRAEKDIWKSTETRLLNEKKSLEQEKSSVNEFLRNTQTMQHEIEKENSNSRRRLESQVSQLEETSKDLKTKLAKAEENLSQTSLRKEVETKDLQNRLDKVNQELSAAKEQYAISKTNETHLQSRVDDLQKALDTKEEKLAVYERRVANAAAANAIAGGSGATGSNDGLSREQSLEIELADLRGDLRSAQTEAEQARDHTEQFKSIAQSVEDALNELKTSSDSYREEMEKQKAENEAEIQSIRSRLEAMLQELTTSQNESSELRQQLETQRASFASEKRSLEDTLTQMTGVEDRAQAAQNNLQAEVRRQAKQTREAHNKYEAELVAHAEDVKKLTRAKEDLSQRNNHIRELTFQTETATANLTNSENSWKNQKEKLEKELQELGKRVEDLTNQNTLLHTSLETASSQANQIRQAASQQGAADGDVSMSGSGTEELHEVIKYLRREKEISDLQMEILKQEATRLRQSLEHANHSLDEVRTTLGEERNRNAGAATSAEQHAALLEKINQVSILRESNITLREEAERAQSRANRLEQSLSSANAEIEPLKEQLRNLNVELEASQAQVKLLQEDNTRWQARAQSILQQYNRIDPEELKALEERATAAESSRDSIRAEMQLLVDGANASTASVRSDLEGQVETGKTRFKALQDQIRQKLKQKDEEHQNLVNEKNAIEQELKALQQQQQQNQESNDSSTQESEARMAETRAERDRAIEEKGQAEKKIQENQKKIQELEAELKAAQSQAAAAAPATGDSNEALETAKAAWEMEKKSIEEKEGKHLQRAKDFLKQKKEADTARDEALAKLAELQKTAGQSTAVPSGAIDGNAATITALEQRVKELQEELVKANALVKELQDKLSASGGSTSGEVDQLKQTHAAALESQRSDLSERYQRQQKEAIEIAVNRAKAAISASPANLGSIQEAVNAAVEARMKEVTASHAEALKASKEEGALAGKNEANLRNNLIKTKNEREIARLGALVEQLQSGGAATSTPSIPSIRGGASGAGAPSVRPSALSVRGRGAATAATTSPGTTRATAASLNANTATPAASTPTAGASVRGSASRGRGSGIAARGGRGGAMAATAAAAAAAGSSEGPQKRKLEAASGANAGAGAAKRGRPAVNKPGGGSAA